MSSIWIVISGTMGLFSLITVQANEQSELSPQVLPTIQMEINDQGQKLKQERGRERENEQAK